MYSAPRYLPEGDSSRDLPDGTLRNLVVFVLATRFVDMLNVFTALSERRTFHFIALDYIKSGNQVKGKTRTSAMLLVCSTRCRRTTFSWCRGWDIACSKDFHGQFPFPKWPVLLPSAKVELTSKAFST